MRIRVFTPDNNESLRRLFEVHRQQEGSVTYDGVHGFGGYKFSGATEAVKRFTDTLPAHFIIFKPDQNGG